MDFKNLIYEERDNVAWITLNRPERGNSLGDELVRDLGEASRLFAEEVHLRFDDFRPRGLAQDVIMATNFEEDT